MLKRASNHISFLHASFHFLLGFRFSVSAHWSLTTPHNVQLLGREMRYSYPNLLLWLRIERILKELAGLAVLRNGSGGD